MRDGTTHGMTHGTPHGGTLRGMTHTSRHGTTHSTTGHSPAGTTEDGGDMVDGGVAITQSQATIHRAEAVEHRQVRATIHGQEHRTTD